MGDASMIRRNSFFALAASMTRMAATTLMFVGIGRFFGPQTFGEFTLAHTYLALFYVFADFGIDIFLATQLAHRKQDTALFVGRYLPLKIILAVVSAGIMCSLALAGNMSPGTSILMLILSVGIIGNGLTTFVFGILKGHEQFLYEAETQLVQNLLLLVGLIVLGLTGASVIVVAVLFVGSRYLGFFFVVARGRKYLALRSFEFSFNNLMESFRQVLPFGLLVVFGMVYLQLDTIMVSLFKSEYDVGLYQAAMKIVMFALAVPDVLSTAVLPTLSRYYHENTGQWKKLAGLVSKTAMYAGLPCGLILFLYPDQLLRLVYGEGGFAPASSVLKILAFTVAIRMPLDVYAIFLTSTGRQSRRTAITILATCCNVALNIFLIPVLGIQGAAAVALLTSTIAGIFYVVSVDPGLRSTISIDGRRLGVLVGTLGLAGLMIALHIESLAVAFIFVIPCFLLLYWFIGYSLEERLLVFALPRRLFTGQKV